jgi:hypothetical protein
VLVGGVVVHDQVQLDRLPGLRIDGVAVGPLDLAQEGDELLVAVLGLQRRGHLASGDLQGGEQGCGAVPVVVVRTTFDPTRLHRQDRDRPVQGLDLRLLINRDMVSLSSCLR